MKGDPARDYEGSPERDRLMGAFEPSYATFTPIRHYAGDIVRDLLVGAAALSLIASPLYADSIRLQFPLIILGAIAAAVVAGLTNPKRAWTATADAVIAGAGLAIYASWGLLGYDAGQLVEFVLRMAIAVVYLFAFYFSMKTVRSFALGEVGAKDAVGEVNSGR